MSKPKIVSMVSKKKKRWGGSLVGGVSRGSSYSFSVIYLVCGDKYLWGGKKTF